MKILERKICGRLVAFSLVELMISLITISCIVAAFAPVITKKLKKQDIAISIAQSSEIFSPCELVEHPTVEKRFKQGGNDNSICQMCTAQNCIICKLGCDDGTYLDSKACECKSCDKFKGEGPDGTCEKCTQDGCTLCKKTSDTYSKGYIIENGKCKKCTGADLASNGVDKCAVPCTPASDEMCINNVRVQCEIATSVSDCKRCSMKGNIPTCSGCIPYKYFDSSTNTCQACGMYACAACHYDTSLGRLACDACDGRGLIGNDNLCSVPCLSVMDNCMHCSGIFQDNKKDYNCETCNEGYYINPNNRKQCLSCSGTRPNCRICRNDGTCAICNEGFF